MSTNEYNCFFSIKTEIFRILLVKFFFVGRRLGPRRGGQGPGGLPGKINELT
jgi:hypothetical protein